MKQYKLRKITTNNKTGDSYGITIPRELTEKYKLQNIFFDIVVSGSTIILNSGLRVETEKAINF